jgi:hypothetical protein
MFVWTNGMKKQLDGSRIRMSQSTFNKNMNEWYDSLTMGQKMALWVEFKAEGDPSNDVIEKAYKDYLKTFKLKVAI